MKESKIKKIARKLKEKIYNFKRKFKSSFHTMKEIISLRKLLRERNIKKKQTEKLKNEQEELKNMTKNKEKFIKEPQYFFITRSYSRDFYDKYAILEPEALTEKVHIAVSKHDNDFMKVDRDNPSFTKWVIKSKDSNKNDAYVILRCIYRDRIDSAGRPIPTWFGVVVDASDENNFDEKEFCKEVNKDVEEMKKNHKTTFDLAAKYPVVWNEKQELNELQKRSGEGEQDIYSLEKGVFWEVPKEKGKKDFFKPHQKEDTNILG